MEFNYISEEVYALIFIKQKPWYNQNINNKNIIVKPFHSILQFKLCRWKVFHLSTFKNKRGLAETKRSLLIISVSARQFFFFLAIILHNFCVFFSSSKKSFISKAKLYLHFVFFSACKEFKFPSYFPLFLFPKHWSRKTLFCFIFNMLCLFLWPLNNSKGGEGKRRKQGKNMQNNLMIAGCFCCWTAVHMK